MQAALEFLKKSKAATEAAGPDDLVMLHLFTAAKAAYGFWRQQAKKVVPLDEAQGVACLALMEAKLYYGDRDPADFRKYFHAVARRKFKEAAADTGSPLRFKKRCDAYDVARRQKKMTDEEICQELGWQQQRLNTARKALAVLKEQQSLHAPVDSISGELTLENSLHDRGPSPEEIVLDKIELEENRKMLQEAISGLPPVAKATISLRFGLPIPELKTLALHEVINIACARTGAFHGLRALQEVIPVDPERGDRVVPADRRVTLSGRRYYGKTTREERKSLAVEKWRRYSSPTEAPPALHESTGEVGH